MTTSVIIYVMECFTNRRNQKKINDKGKRKSYVVPFINNEKVEMVNLSFENCGGPHETYYRRNDDNQASIRLHKTNLSHLFYQKHRNWDAK